MRREGMYACLVFIGGIAVGLWGDGPKLVLVLLIFSLGISLATSFRRQAVAILVITGIGMAGAFLASAAREKWEDPRPTGLVSGEAVLLSDLRSVGWGERAVVRFLRCDATWCPTEKLLVEFPQGNDLALGDRISLRCESTLPKNRGDGFDYAMYLAKDGIGYLCGSSYFEVVDEKDRFLHFFSVARTWVARSIDHTLPEPEAGLARGLLLGGNDALSDEAEETFRDAGLLHIVAISGYNILLVANAILFFGIFVGLMRNQAMWFAVAGVAVFVILVGSPASAVRAAIMASLLFLSLQSGRLSSGFSMLLVAASLMLLENPLLLRYDVGFQFSFLATAAIALSASYRENVLESVHRGRSVFDAALITGAVLLLILPLSAYTFGTMQLYGLLSNILVLPLLPFAMFFSFLSALSSSIPVVSEIIGWMSYAVLHSLVVIAETVSHLPSAHFSVSSFSFLWLFLWYGVITILVLLGMKRPIYAP